MNSFTIKISGESEIEKPLEIGKAYQMQLQADCISITKTDNQDGTFTYKHTLKGTISEVVSELGDTIKVKDKRRQSQKLRGQLVSIAMDNGLDEEVFYEAQMVKIRHYLPEILDYISKLE